ncbi:MAG: PepSY domain-containing protein [Gammaproteobacteria bacterium]|nr:PepSY domain-containing protein [Gammaproteobacteria bacterium]
MNNPPREEQAGKSRVGLRRLLALHRTLGLASALFVMVLAVTGLALQHSARMNLDSSFLRWELWLSWYRIEVPDITVGYVDGNSSIALIGNSVYFNATPVASDVSDLQGFVGVGQMFVAASADSLLLINENAQLVEVLSAVHGIPDSIRALARDPQGSLLINTTAGVFKADLERLTFEPSDMISTTVDWSSPVQLDSSLISRVRSDYGDTLISWERFMLDLHSGRILGDWGVILMDTMAVFFLLMAGSGVWIWSRRRSNTRTR